MPYQFLTRFAAVNLAGYLYGTRACPASILQFSVLRYRGEVVKECLMDAAILFRRIIDAGAARSLRGLVNVSCGGIRKEVV